MRPTILCAAAFLLAGSAGAAFAAPGDAEVLQPIQRFFDAFARRDKAGMLAETAPDAEVMSERDGDLRRLTLDALADKIVAFQPGASLAEPIHDPIIHIDHTLAVVWAPYRLIVDGKPLYCGVDAITLLQLHGQWRIVNISDDNRDGCG